MKCPNCQYDNDSTAKFCAKCGAVLNVALPNNVGQDKTPGPSREEVVAEWRQRYKQDEQYGKQSAGSFDPGDFRKSLLWTAIPLVTFSLISLLSAFANGLGFVWFAGALSFLVALVIGFIALASGSRATAAGVFAGIAIGVVSLGLTCITNINNMSL